MTSDYFHSLLSEPFGPYQDFNIFHEKLQSTKKNVLSLTSFRMTCARQPIGFDETESLNTVRINNNPVLFRGILEIHSLSQLSEQGHRWLEQRLRKRDVEKRLDGGAINPTSNLTLAALYGEGAGGNLNVFGGHERRLKLKVWVQGVKNMTAAFLTSDLLPTGLLFTSKDQNRKYEVATMDVEIFQRSRTFLRRYQILDLFQTIIQGDPSTPTDDRTVDYFVSQYLQKYVFTEFYHRRLICDPNDPDVDKNGKTRLRRHPRPVHRGEVYSAFAEHCEWILNEPWVKRKKMLNLKEWEKFCMRVKKGRRRAKSGMGWGLAFGAEVDVSEDEDDGDADDEMQCARVNARKSQDIEEDAPTQSVKKIRKKRIHSTPPVELVEFPEELPPHGIQDCLYDVDFSEASTPPATDSDDLSDNEPPDPEVVALIPPCFFRPPNRPGIDFKWDCPVEGCTYIIDLLSLSNEDMEGLGDNVVQRMRSKNWLITDREPEMVHLNMVDRHYHEHLTKLGIKWSGVGKTAKMVWIHPQRHLKHPPAGTLEVKCEE